MTNSPNPADALLPSTEENAPIVTDNYIDVRHTYHLPPNDDGMSIKNTDVWFAVKPGAPAMEILGSDGKPLEDREITMQTAWTINKAGQPNFYILDRDDITGLRKLLDLLDAEFDRRDMEKFAAEFKDELDKDDKPE